jgi:murein DD-endopeptidase MepM/ murein hydrolase activator NlpD
MSKWETIKGSAGFFITMAVCLLVIGVSGYYLLLDDSEETPPAVVETPPAETAVIAPTEEPLLPETPAVVEVLAPEPVEEASSMPELEIDDTPVVAEAPRLIVTPVHGEVLAAFSVDELAYNPTLEDWRTHDGVDIQAASGATVLAACNGTVLSVRDDPLMGTTVVVEHDGGYQTTYANLQSHPPVEAGEIVSAGQILGAVGDTAAAESAQGPHLHFSVSRDGEAVNPHEFLEQ